MIPKTNTAAIKMANETLAALDTLSDKLLRQASTLGLREDAVLQMAQSIDKVADEVEVAAFGKEAFEARKAAQMGKTAQVIQKESDEPYMNTFANPMAPVQTESDEPYMKAYGDDQSSAVIHGKSSTGRPLAPGH